jgi:hypothetical protein
MTKVSRSPRHKEAPASATRAAARVAPRLETADRRLLDFGAADQRALDRAYRACRAVDGPADAAGDRGDAPQEAKSRPEIAPQGLEKIESGIENCSGSEASNLQDLVLENEPNQRPRSM